MFVRLFRHTGYESILEGEITETGVGFTLRRRLSSLKNLFKWSLPKFLRFDRDRTPIPMNGMNEFDPMHRYNDSASDKKMNSVKTDSIKSTSEPKENEKEKSMESNKEENL